MAKYVLHHFPENFAKTRDVGQDAKQWPGTEAFEIAPESRPRVSAATQAVKQPTAVACSLFGSSGTWFGHQSGRGARAYVACMDGTLRLYATDSLADDSAAAAQVPLAAVGAIKVGRNPCCIAYDRTAFSAGRQERHLGGVARGDRKLQRIRISGDAGEPDPN